MTAISASSPFPSPERARVGRTLRFWAYLVPHVVVAPVLCFGVTFLHEMAHVAAALSLGGVVTDFSMLPGPTDLGHMRWNPPLGAGPVEHAFVSVAPYLMWALCAGVVLLVTSIPNRFHWSVGSTLFVWGYAVPVGDITSNLLAPTGDLAAPGLEGALVTLSGLTAVVIAWALGFLVQRRLFPDAKLGGLAYVVTTFVMGGLWVVAASLGWAVARLG